mmetsp:Transcript_728/g.2761  ORF Transcript_728/g.2761 Transcript_728/m.2761 type:complete len:206 (+) Transcript_728:75-692(+)
MILCECALHLEYCHRCCVDFRDMNAYHRANAHHQPVATNPSADMRHAVMVCTGLGFIDDKWRDGIDSALEHATPVHRNVSAKAGRDSARRFIEGAKKKLKGIVFVAVGGAKSTRPRCSVTAPFASPYRSTRKTAAAWWCTAKEQIFVFSSGMCLARDGRRMRGGTAKRIGNAWSTRNTGLGGAKRFAVVFTKPRGSEKAGYPSKR